jgi:serine protease AprX
MVTVGSNVAAGSYPLVISAVGGNVTRTLSVTLVVVSVPKATFAISVAAPALVVTHGKSSTYTVQTVVSSSPPPAITLAIGGLPAGVTARFSPATLTGSGRSTLTLNAASSTRRGTQAVTISGTAGATTHSSTLNLTVN